MINRMRSPAAILNTYMYVYKYSTSYIVIDTSTRFDESTRDLTNYTRYRTVAKMGGGQPRMPAPPPHPGSDSRNVILHIVVTL